MDQKFPMNFDDDDRQMREIFHDLHASIIQLRDHARRAGDVELGAIIWRNALDAEAKLKILSQGSDDITCLDQLSLALEELESTARQFFRDVEVNVEETGKRCAVLRAVSRMLLRMARELEEGQQRDETPFLIQELRDIDNALNGEERNQDQVEEDELAESELIASTKIRIIDLRTSVLETQAKKQIAAAKKVQSCSLNEAYRVFRLSRALARSSVELVAGEEALGKAGKNNLTELSSELRQESRRLRDLFVSFAKTTEDEGGQKTVVHAARWVTGELDQARVDSFNQRDEAGIEHLRVLEEDGLVFYSGMRVVAKRLAASGSAKSDEHRVAVARRAAKKLKKMVKRMGHVIADRVLVFRLDQAFGKKQVRRWEKFVFWLIVVAMLLLVIDHFGGDSIEVKVQDTGSVSQVRDNLDGEAWEEVGNDLWRQLGWTIWVDTVICFILLWDFLIRLSLSPRRFSYFRRHFITEFVPSLPFGPLHGLMAVDKIRFIRLARLFVGARALRIARPVIRILRLFLFLARAADRLVERNSWFLNQNIVFSTEEEVGESSQTLLSRARNIDSWISTKTSSVLVQLPVGAQVVGANWRMGLIEAEFSRHDGGIGAASILQRHKDERVRDLNVEVVIENLRSLDDNQVADIVGVDVARQLTASLSFFRLPFLRRFAFARFVLGPSGAPDPLWTTARLGRMCGDLLAFVARVVHWFSDLYGTITGAQFLDRVGMQLIKATRQPAKRLVTLVFAVVFIFFFFWLTQIKELIDWAKDATGILGSLLTILGLVCFLPLGLGIWLRRIAGQAVDFFDRVSEAQFFALTETVKEANAEQDVGYLVDRVLLPEHQILQPQQSDAERAHVRATFLDACVSGEVDLEGISPIPWAACDAMMLYYRDFIDGAYFHKNDTKIANMLVGNLTLENIRRNRLSFDAKRFKRLEKLDIGRDKGGLIGPRVWFNFITHSVAQYTARLIIEYNQHCVPQDEYAAATSDDRRIFDDWLAKRKRISAARRNNEVITGEDSASIDSSGGTLVYRTTEFNALNFLTKENKRDEAVRKRFGDEVSDLLIEDRENLIRDIFGTFPMNELAKSKRTINPYRFYRRYLARGRVFLFPLTALWLVLKGIKFLIVRIIQIVKDVLRPNDRPLRISAGRSGFEVARRKIHRMRRPVVMEAVRMRADFDVEYLGIALPEFIVEPIRPQDLLVEDLRQLDASERDWESFRETKTNREQQVRILSRFLKSHTKEDESIIDDILRRNSMLAGREVQIMRVITTAFVCDHLGVYSILDAIEELSDLIERLPKEQSRWQKFSMSKKTKARVERYWSLIANEDVSVEMIDVLAWTLDRSHRVSRGHLDNLDEYLPEQVNPQDFVYETLVQVGEKPSSWCEQMIAVRTVQSLGMLDLSGYERMILDLGGYHYSEATRGESTQDRHL